MADKDKQKPAPTPAGGHGYGELLARFQLETERAIGALRTDMLRLHEELALKVAVSEDHVTQLKATVENQTKQLEDAVHHTRKGVEECNLALKQAAKAAREAADSAAVFEKLRDSQPDFHRQVQELETRLAKVVDTNTHLQEQVTNLTRQLDELEVVSESMEETKGEIRGLDLAVQRLDKTVRTSRPV